MQRRTTNTVHVGDVEIGSGYPIAVQSLILQISQQMLHKPWH